MPVTDPSDEELLQIAKEATKNSYSPYSKLKVGAAIVSDDNEIFVGCNIENSSYGLSICAERVAIFNAISKGKKKFKKIAIITSEGNGIMPCGACRQVLSEFSDNIEIITLNNDKKIVKFRLSDLLPYSFKLKSE
ncbi:cytidine deaminase [Acidianus sulfidivorans JP7]|uniref:cytidine deaminase n=1 Tax=Acidianus sulfidivorans JP7 TaxID=619593 RepID=A0A2U9IMF4_9CREN|nr:cytidine deaminase [Acidianus sulfidivorans]AWR97206.1 cytidine deaminase [Acidianus sulfidivorans JP7]